MAGTACGLVGSVRHPPGLSIPGCTVCSSGYAYQSWDWYAAKPDRNGFELYLALDDVFDSADQNLGGERPAFFRAAFGWTLRVADRWNIGVE